jgi:DNA helicase HerA-like ATPase
MSDGIFLGAGPGGAEPQSLLLKRANRHGLVAGATGTGKTVTLQVLAEGFARMGVPVFAADVKGDLSGVALAGDPPPKWAAARALQIGLADYAPEKPPVVFWDVYGEKGHPIRATLQEMGPMLTARLLELSEAQEGALAVAFKVADEEGLLLLDLADLRALMTYVSQNSDTINAKYGLVSPTSVAAVQRRLLQLEQQGAEKFFGEPALKLSDFMRTAADGRGVVNILAADKLIQAPRLYSTFLLWLLSELFEELPEIGDPDKPKLVFFFDEAHLLFSDTPPALLHRIEQVVRLIRSKGVGVYFVTQNPQDLPPTVLSQIGNRVQHALRAYTPGERKAIKAAADSFRENPGFRTEEVLTELGIGEALVSLLDEKGAPTIVARTLIRPPASRVGALSEAERQSVIKASPLAGVYDKTKDRESAYEILSERAERAADTAEREAREAAREKQETKAKRSGGGGGRRRQTVVEKAAGSAARELGRGLVQALIRGVLGGMKRR